MQATDEQIETILERHHVTATDWPAFIAFVDHGHVANADFSMRLVNCVNYKAALDEIVALIAQPYQHLHSAAPFESLEIPETL